MSPAARCLLRLLIIGCLAAAAGCAAAALSWHGIWVSLAVETADPLNPATIQAQERWQTWGSFSLIALVAALAAVATHEVLGSARHDDHDWDTDDGALTLDDDALSHRFRGTA